MVEVVSFTRTRLNLYKFYVPRGELGSCDAISFFFDTPLLQVKLKLANWGILYWLLLTIVASDSRSDLETINLREQKVALVEVFMCSFVNGIIFHLLQLYGFVAGIKDDYCESEDAEEWANDCPIARTLWHIELEWSSVKINRKEIFAYVERAHHFTVSFSYFI